MGTCTDVPSHENNIVSKTLKSLKFYKMSSVLTLRCTVTNWKVRRINFCDKNVKVIFFCDLKLEN